MLHHFLTLSQVCSIVHVCSMYCTRKVRDTNISCKQAIDAYWQPDPNRIQSFDMFVCEWYLTWQVLSERSLREVLFLCLGPRKSEILLQFVLNKSEAKQNNLFDDTSKKMGASSNDTSTLACPEWNHVMVGLQKRLPREPSKILSSDAICICVCVLHTMAFWLNIFGGVPKLTHIRCGVVKACSQVSMTGMQLTMQEAQTSQSLSVYGDYLLKHLVHYFVSFGLRTSHWDCWRIHLSFSSKR